MKKLIILLLFISFSCDGDSSADDKELIEQNLYEFLKS